MSSPLDDLVNSAKQHRFEPTSAQRERMKKGIIAMSTLSAAAASGFGLSKFVIIGVTAVAVGGGATLAVKRLSNAQQTVRKTSSEAQVVPVPLDAQSSEPTAALTQQPAPPEELPAPGPEIPEPAPAPKMPSIKAARAKKPEKHVTVAQQPPSLSPANLPAMHETPAIPGKASQANSRQFALELRLLQTATDALDVKDFKAVDQSLGVYERDIVNGSLAAEAGLLRVLSWCESGQVEQAQARARQLLLEHPRNPVIQRLKASCVKSIVVP